ncbi:MAG: hypothetical protein DYG92_03015 [Leptolyngbya sp. PLA1]|nr:hypothetical protein [Leptolyngbya sp. PLA1]
MDESRALIAGVALPLVLSLIGLLVVWWGSAKRGQRWGEDEAAQRQDRMRVVASSWVIALAAVAGVLAGFWKSDWPPTGARGWLPVVMAGVAVLAAGTGLPRVGAVVALLCPVLLGAGLWLVARNKVKNTWGPWEAAVWIGVSAVLVTMAWASLTKAGRSRGWYPWLLLVGVGVCASVTIVLTGHIDPALMAGGVCGVLGGGVLAGLWRPRVRGGAGVGLAGASLGVLMFYACALGTTPVACGVLITLAVLAAGLVSPDDTAGMVGAKGRLVRGVAPAVLGAASVVIALLNQPA